MNSKSKKSSTAAIVTTSTAASASAAAPTLFNMSADPDIKAYREFWAKPIDAVMDDIIRDPNGVVNPQVFYRFTLANPSDQKKIEARLETLKSLTRELTPGESFLLGICERRERYRHKRMEYLVSAANATVVGAQYLFCVLVVAEKFTVGFMQRVDPGNEIKSSLESNASSAHPHALALDYKAMGMYENLMKEKLRCQNLSYTANDRIVMGTYISYLYEASELGSGGASKRLYQLYSNSIESWGLIDEKKTEIYFCRALRQGEMPDVLAMANLCKKRGELGRAIAYFRLEKVHVVRSEYESDDKAELSDSNGAKLVREFPDNPEVIYHGAVLLLKTPNYTPPPQLEEKFNQLAFHNPRVFDQLLMWESLEDQFHIWNLLNDVTKIEVCRRLKAADNVISQRIIAAVDVFNTDTVSIITAYASSANPLIFSTVQNFDIDRQRLASIYKDLKSFAQDAKNYPANEVAKINAIYAGTSTIQNPSEALVIFLGYLKVARVKYQLQLPPVSATTTPKNRLIDWMDETLEKYKDTEKNIQNPSDAFKLFLGFLITVKDKYQSQLRDSASAAAPPVPDARLVGLLNWIDSVLEKYKVTEAAQYHYVRAYLHSSQNSRQSRLK